MLLRFLLSIYAIFKFLYNRFITMLVWKQRSKPLPYSVAHIYDKEKYTKFLSYKREYRKINLITDLITLIISLFIALSNFYSMFDFSNPYLAIAGVYTTIFIISALLEITLNYYVTFKIEEKYGMNHKTKKEFMKDYFIEELVSFLSTGLIFLFLTFICENIYKWTNGFNITYTQSFLFCLMIVGMFFIIIVLISCLSLISLRMQYKFTEMEDCELKRKIEGYCKESKKKIHHIKVYNESKKSNSKNAFLLKFFWYREFGIADNFLDENSEDELLAVLLHEVGHLKHKKNIWNYLSYLTLLIVICFLVWLLPNAQIIININEWINNSFNLVNTNYYLSLSAFIYALSPFMAMFKVFNNYVSCKEEKEADFNAVDKGYGQALIDTFTKVSEDELMDVNPHPFIELTTYDHPGMATRIAYIQKRMKDNLKLDNKM